MKCNVCGNEISEKDLAQHLGANGGKKSKRILTKEQAIGMVEAREKKKLDRTEGAK